MVNHELQSQPPEIQQLNKEQVDNLLQKMGEKADPYSFEEKPLFNQATTTSSGEKTKPPETLTPVEKLLDGVTERLTATALMDPAEIEKVRAKQAQQPAPEVQPSPAPPEATVSEQQRLTNMIDAISRAQGGQEALQQLVDSSNVNQAAVQALFNRLVSPPAPPRSTVTRPTQTGQPREKRGFADTIKSIFSPKEHWKRKVEKYDSLAKKYENKFGEGLFVDNITDPSQKTAENTRLDQLATRYNNGETNLSAQDIVQLLLNDRIGYSKKLQMGLAEARKGEYRKILEAAGWTGDLSADSIIEWKRHKYERSLKEQNKKGKLFTNRLFTFLENKAAFSVGTDKYGEPKASWDSIYNRGGRTVGWYAWYGVSTLAYNTLSSLALKPLVKTAVSVFNWSSTAAADRYKSNQAHYDRMMKEGEGYQQVNAMIAKACSVFAGRDAGAKSWFDGFRSATILGALTDVGIYAEHHIENTIDSAKDKIHEIYPSEQEVASRVTENTDATNDLPLTQPEPEVVEKMSDSDVIKSEQSDLRLQVEKPIIPDVDVSIDANINTEVLTPLEHMDLSNSDTYGELYQNIHHALSQSENTNSWANAIPKGQTQEWFDQNYPSIAARDINWVRADMIRDTSEILGIPPDQVDPIQLLQEHPDLAELFERLDTCHDAHEYATQIHPDYAAFKDNLLDSTDIHKFADKAVSVSESTSDIGEAVDAIVNTDDVLSVAHEISTHINDLDVTTDWTSPDGFTKSGLVDQFFKEVLENNPDLVTGDIFKTQNLEDVVSMLNQGEPGLGTSLQHLLDTQSFEDYIHLRPEVTPFMRASIPVQ